VQVRPIADKSERSAGFPGLWDADGDSAAFPLPEERPRVNAAPALLRRLRSSKLIRMATFERIAADVRSLQEAARKRLVTTSEAQIPARRVRALARLLAAARRKPGARRGAMVIRRRLDGPPA
jgi:hypothetical protein